MRADVDGPPDLGVIFDILTTSAEPRMSFKHVHVTHDLLPINSLEQIQRLCWTFLQSGKERDVPSFFEVHCRSLAMTRPPNIDKTKSCGKENNCDIEMPFGTHYDNMLKINAKCLASLRVP